MAGSKDIYFQILMKEWEMCRVDIGRYDIMVIEMRKWTVSVSALIGLAAFSVDRYWIMLIGYVAVVLFWIMDAHYKTYQKVYIRRTSEIESELRRFKDSRSDFNNANFDFPNIADKFTLEFKKPLGTRVSQTYNQAWKIGVLMPYFGVFCMLTAGLLALLFGNPKPLQAGNNQTSSHAASPPPDSAARHGVEIPPAASLTPARPK